MQDTRDPDFVLPGEETVPVRGEYSVVTDLIKDAFSGFCRAAGECKVSPRKDFDDLASRTKDKKVCTARRLIDFMIMIMAPGFKNEFEDLIFRSFNDGFWNSHKSVKFDELMEVIVDAYEAAVSKQDKRNVLAMIAGIVPLADLQKYIPGLTNYQFVTARKKKLSKEITVPGLLQRYEPLKVNLFVEFITR